MQKKVSIILIHYNQPEYVEIALDSIFKQTYKNIELIFADDSSDKIDIKELKKFCKKKNKNNIDIIWQFNKENIGTVKNVNCAVKKSSGDYILIFAADDKLYNKSVIEEFVKSFEKNNEEDIAMIFGQCFMMDEQLKHIKTKYVNDEEAYKFNELSSLEQFRILTTKCLIAMGACMINSSIIKKEGMFDERYNYVEDWSIFLSLTKKGYRIIYDGTVDALLHRDGGISNTEIYNNVPSHILGFREDLVNITINEVFPLFSNLNYREKCELMDKFYSDKNCYITSGGKFNNSILINFKLHNLFFFVRRKLDNIHDNHNTKKEITKHKMCVISIFIMTSIMLNDYFSKRFNLLFNVITYVLLLFLILQLILFIISIVVYNVYEIKRKIRR